MADQTKNYKFRKPTEDEFYNIQDQNGNWDSVDQVIDDLDRPEFEDYTTGTSLPSTEEALAAIVSKSKVSSLFSNIKAFCSGVITLGRLANNCLTTEAGFALDARQGKALSDQISEIRQQDNGYTIIDFTTTTALNVMTDIPFPDGWDGTTTGIIEMWVSTVSDGKHWYTQTDRANAFVIKQPARYEIIDSQYKGRPAKAVLIKTKFP